MAKKKTAEYDDVYNDLTKNHGGVMLTDVGNTKYFIDTGNLALNYINSGRFIGGGIPGGKITEIYGPPAASKSLVGMSVLHGVQQLNGYAIYLDCEHATNRDFAVAAGHVDPTKLIVFEPETLEQSFLKIYNVIRKIREKKGPEVPICFIYDSIGASPCEREFRETDLPENYKKTEFKSIVGGNEQPGERAKICSKEFRKLTSVLDKNNASLFVVNQVRQKIGVLFGSPETTAGGGEALKFYASCRIRVSPHKIIENTDLEIPIGVNIKVQNKKCRSFSPHWETEGVQLYFDSGINPLGGLLGIFLKSKRIKSTGSAGMFQVEEPYADGKTITFRSSKVRNDVPVELLLDCPAIVDAKSKDEVEKYLSAFGDAIDLTNSDSVEETEITAEDLEKKIGSSS